MKTSKAILTVSAILIAAVALVLTAGCSKKEQAEKKQEEKKFVIGFSQCTTTEPWRVLFNKKLKEEAAKHPEVELIIQDAQDKTENQVAHLESFIAKEVDAILVSPKVSSGFTRVMKSAEEKGIPIIVLDRDLEPQNYTSFVGADNQVIGEAAGRFVVDILGGPGEAKGKVYEIWGGKGSEPAHDRHNGFHRIVDKEPGIEVTGDQDCDWKQDLAKKTFETILQRHQDIDVVYAHNDPMAYGAYLAAKEAGLEKNIKFIGIDGNPDEGAVWVKEGKLAATFLYPTPGDQGLLTALRVLNGIDVEKKIVLPTAAITAKNADKFVE
ncbi:MAG: substrate-binding domain-containing protein [bacterium]